MDTCLISEGHRFLTKSEEVNNLWHEIMGEDLLRVRRTSRILYKRKFFKYPMNLMDVVVKLGLMESFLCFISYLWRKVVPYKNEKYSFEGWIINCFGERLYRIFFKTYTEKVWAVPCAKISADWAQQRIRGLSLKVAVKSMLAPGKKNKPKTFSEVFKYPKTGPGEFYRRLKEASILEGSEWSFSSKVVKWKHDGAGKVLSIEILSNGTIEEVPIEEHLFSSMPLPHLIGAMDPAPPKEVLAAAKTLKFRSFLVVNVILDRESLFPDQWLYIHSPEVRLGRIQNYKNWSPAMVADMGKTSLGLEYFCYENDFLWDMDDIDLVNFAMKELEMTGVAHRKDLINGFVVRYKNAYPVYSLKYKRSKELIKRYLAGFSNLTTMGRSGLFRYDNSDHALLTGIYAAKNYLGQSEKDIWDINTEEQYLEA